MLNQKSQSAFTIVELLVVIVVIGILAAITVVSYVGINLRAAGAVLQSDLSNASTQLEIDKTANGTYPATKEAANNGKGLQPSPGTTFDYSYASSDDSYTLAATRGDISYYITSDNKTPVAGTITPTETTVWEQIVSKYYHTCGVASGKAYCWGYNDDGQLGNDTTTVSLIPVPVDASGALSGKTVTAIANTDYSTCAIASGKAYCWGDNSDGELGNNSTDDSHIPVAVDASGVLNGKTVTAIAAGDYHTCVIASGQAYCWGWNRDGGLGNNSTIDSHVPVAVDTTGVLNGKTVTAISAGDSGTCVIASGQAYCWGFGINGELGNNTTANSLVPVAVNTTGVLNGKTVTAISAGSQHTCAIASGQAYCWGANWGELGDGTWNDSHVPVAVDTTGVLNGKTVTAIAAGYDTCAIAGGQAYCWGGNYDGEFGNNTTDGSLVPVAVDTTGVLNGKTVASIFVAQYHVCAIASDKPHCWGSNQDGLLGNNSTTSSLVPVAVDTTNVF